MIVASGSLTTTSYAVLGFLASRDWSSYELTKQMDRSLRHVWPRAVSKLYEEPKKLVEHGLARAREERQGRRPRTVYAITPKGRRALAAWLAEPGAGPVLEFEQLLKLFFSDAGTTADAVATLATARSWAVERAAASAAIGEQYLDGTGPFPDRLPQQILTASFLNDLYDLVHRWATWAEELVSDWPDDPRDAVVSREVLEQVAGVAADVARRGG
jgi:DNA-binding PadR family transcriptional regulator